MVKLKKLINFFGGPSTGKSTYAAELYSDMKKRKLSVELVTEFPKDLIWDGLDTILLCDQLFVFANQHRRINRLVGKVEYIITDSPILLSTIYFNKKENIYNYDIFNKLVLDTFNKYPNLNILLERNSYVPFEQTGRKENIDLSKELDLNIDNYLSSNNINYYKHSNNIIFNTLNYLELIKYV